MKPKCWSASRSRPNACSSAAACAICSTRRPGSGGRAIIDNAECRTPHPPLQGTFHPSSFSPHPDYFYRSISMTGDQVIRNVRPLGAAAVDIVLHRATIGAIVPAGSAAADIPCLLDGGARLLLPGLVESLVHFDKTLWGMA